ncbi:Six-hairpin glycosidase-like protein [Protomyces lactucae-debilis]|uniref:glucan 1,4-alpha-glucosidase n=1 Tax=Protomyces lactucae-debilis TaxID=2754530 RepID=A0A1Y2FDC2_PROLT|nr:Six-hairpin glycosidase-like protein [Protomyces lactucae-debilis]ORY81921.1 Six-hairpin glycosidase-like protein [Protomyces lactucae-debilis]
MKVQLRSCCFALLSTRSILTSTAQLLKHTHPQTPFFRDLVSSSTPQDLPFTQWLTAQKNVSLAGLFRNIYGVDSPYPGVVIAAPQDGANYYYQWTRDAAIVMKPVVKLFAGGRKDLESLIRAFIANTAKLQKVPNLSDGLTEGVSRGLGEPKFYVNGTAFNEDWGRPQHDGPALRALVIMEALRHFKDTAYVSETLQNIVKPDVEYVSRTWQDDKGFDLWEEQQGLHFFTNMVQSRCLREAVEVFWQAGDTGASEWYRMRHQELAVQIEAFWDYTNEGTFKSHMSLKRSGKKTGVDCGNLLGVLHGAGGTAPLYRPSSAKTLASLVSLVKSMQSLYPLNKKLNGVAIGRYPSDTYDGHSTHSLGNPWFLCTSTVAEVLYRAMREIAAVKQFQVNEINVYFAQMVDSKLKSGQTLKDTELTDFLDKMHRFADSFLEVEQQFVTKSLGMSEQFHREDGKQMGARDLTWSYAAFWSAVEAREGVSI